MQKCTLEHYLTGLYTEKCFFSPQNFLMGIDKKAKVE